MHVLHALKKKINLTNYYMLVLSNTRDTTKCHNIFITFLISIANKLN